MYMMISCKQKQNNSNWPASAVCVRAAKEAGAMIGYNYTINAIQTKFTFPEIRFQLVNFLVCLSPSLSYVCVCVKRETENVHRCSANSSSEQKN